MIDPLKGPRLKLQRAYQHLVDLERCEQHFFETNPIRVVIDEDQTTGDRLAKVVLETLPPEEMHVIAGELIYQLRSVLDQIAVTLARLSLKRPNPKNVYYPTGDCLRAFKTNCRSYLKGFDQSFVRQIIKTRPYDGGNDTLRAVFRMANIDKHMELIAIGTSGGIKGISHFTVSHANIGFIYTGPGDLCKGVVFSDLGKFGTITPNHPNAKIHVGGQITIGEDSPYSRRPLVLFLRQMVEAVQNVYDSVCVLCESRPQPRVFTLSTSFSL